jgi:hypothetical protein
MGIEPTRSLFPDPSPVLKTGAGTSRASTPKAVSVRTYVNIAGLALLRCRFDTLSVGFKPTTAYRGNTKMRVPKLRVKLVKGIPYYFSEAGGTPKYYGKVSEVSQQAAEEKFNASLQARKDSIEHPSPMEAGSVGGFQPTEFPPIKLQELSRKFLAWLATENKSAKTIEGRRLNLQRFLRFMGNVDVHTLDIQDLEKFRAQFKGTLNRRHHEVSVKALLR